MTIRNLEFAFRAKSLAFIGATPREGSVGQKVVRNLRNGGFHGAIWPVNPQRIQVEESSADTCENAEESLLATRPKAGEQWLLVTSASHMPRAVACFRAVGFPVIPYPVDYRTRGAESLRAQSSISEGLRAADLAAHEWLGLLGYWLLGRTSELFPAP